MDHKPELRSALLFTMTVELGGMQDIGAVPIGHRRIAEVKGGRFEGEELRGKILPGGGDWLVMRGDGVLLLDVRLALETDDKQLIYMTYRGMRHGPQWVMDRLNKGEKVDPSEYYFRSVPWFETASTKYEWLNRIITIGVGRREAVGPVYDVFQIL